MLRIIGIGVMLLLSVSLVTAQTDSCSAVGGTWAEDEGKCNLDTTLEITMEYPIEVVGHENLQNMIDAYLGQLKRDFVGFYNDTESHYSNGYTWTLDENVQVFHYSEDVISIVFQVYEFTGGAHGNTNYNTVTYDLAADEVVTLDDVFQAGSDPFAIIAPIVEEELTLRLGEMADTSWIEEGSGENPANYQYFALTPDSLMIFFPPYQIAAYAAGTQTVEIPLTDLASVLAPAFQP
ncbi:MAG: DUF3298 and DUF4163 domain-containing protein [Anaerolineae bacterium]|nr:DUF3298 and DUF4163 domain-containing protein [Anaerolineae bacterium]